MEDGDFIDFSNLYWYRLLFNVDLDAEFRFTTGLAVAFLLIQVYNISLIPVLRLADYFYLIEIPRVLRSVYALIVSIYISELEGL